MSRLATSFVLGYHGCTRRTARNVLAGESELKKSEKAYDWLGAGVYFWESDPLRALEFAKWKESREPDFREPVVIGAVIDLGNCFDLVVRDNIEMLREAHKSLMEFRRKEEKKPLQNGKSGDHDQDRVLRYLDCAVIEHFYKLNQSFERKPYDTARGMFTEGQPAYDGAGFLEKSHVQIAVRSLDSIKGVFIPRPYPVL